MLVKLKYFRRVKYIGSYLNIKSCPDTGEKRRVVFTGRSNSGKSSLISALSDHKNLARVSSTAGKTRALNYFFVPDSSDEKKGFFLVDMPGYGYARISSSEKSD